jgi:hypothetical protein
MTLPFVSLFYLFYKKNSRVGTIMCQFLYWKLHLENSYGLFVNIVIILEKKVVVDFRYSMLAFRGAGGEHLPLQSPF